MAPIDHREAKSLLLSLYPKASESLGEEAPAEPEGNAADLDVLFGSKTQSYREALLGCALVRLMDPSVNIRLPYASHGSGSFNGRSLDEYAVNPFLQEQQFPCSKGPYLATFRRSVKFLPETAEGLRDKDGYAAMMNLLKAAESCASREESEAFVMCLLRRFIALRNAADVPLARPGRLSIDQYRQLLDRLVHCKSGGLLPVLIAVAFFQTLAERHSLAWEISWQGINVADSATGAEGDVTIKEGGKTILAVEITERPLDDRRIVSTFNTKIILNDVREYLFVFTGAGPDSAARSAAHDLFAQGYEINFANVVELIVNNFLAMPADARETFAGKMLALLVSRGVPTGVKVKWNECVKSVLRTL
jgi:hypothetical protein